MKNNLNPLYLTEFYGLGTMPIVGVGSKYLKDYRMTQRIINEFPDPMKLREWLYTLPSNEAKQIAQRIHPQMSQNQYRFLIKRYILKGSFGRYILHAIGGPVSGIGNALDATNNEFNDVKTIIRNNVG